MMVVGSRQSSNDSIFYLCTLFQGKTEGVRDLKSDTSAYLLERVFPLSKGLRAECFFLSFFVILRHCAPPSSLNTMHILPGESSNITTLLHRYSSLGSLTFSHSFLSPPLSSCLLFLHLLSSSVSQSVALLFMYFPLPTLLDPLYLLPSTFTSLPLLWHCRIHSFPLSLLSTLLISHLPSAYASAYFEVVAHNRYSILMRTLMNF